MTAQKTRCCYMCKFHNVYWEGQQFAGCECLVWDDIQLRETHHTCGRSLSPESSRRSGTSCPRFVYFPPEEFLP